LGRGDKMMKLLIFALLALQAWAEKTDYTGYTVYRIVPGSEEDLALLWQMKEDYDTTIDFWRDPVSVGQPVDVMVPPGLQPTLKSTLRGASVMVEDVQALIDTEQADKPDKQVLDSYSRYGDIEDWLKSTCTGDCSLVNIGQTYEGRDMWVAQIGGDTDKPILFLECGIHAREWIAPAVCLNIINRLVTQGSSMLDDYNFHIITNANPDGYEFTFTDNRMWRKTRSVNENSSCFGCDPNRNFDYEFGGAGTSTNPCSDIFRGAEAFSEVETRNIRDYVTPRQERIRAYYAVHSYGQWVLIPWSYARNEYPEDFDDMERVGDAAADGIRANSGRAYVVGQSANLLGATAGCSDDWAKGSCNIKFAYTLELRDTGTYGFILPENQIQPNFEEIWAAFEAMAEMMAADYPGP